MNYHAMTHEELVALIETRDLMARRMLRELRETRLRSHSLEPTPAAKAALARTKKREYDKVRRELEELAATVRKLQRQVYEFSIALKEED